MTEKEQCLKLVENLIKKHEHEPKLRDVLKALRKRIRLIGTHGGPLNEQQAAHLNNSISANQQCA